MVWCNEDTGLVDRFNYHCRCLRLGFVIMSYIRMVVVTINPLCKYCNCKKQRRHDTDHRYDKGIEMLKYLAKQLGPTNAVAQMF
jgi:hypothetical protein